MPFNDCEICNFNTSILLKCPTCSQELCILCIFKLESGLCPYCRSELHKNIGVSELITERTLLKREIRKDTAYIAHLETQVSDYEIMEVQYHRLLNLESDVKEREESLDKYESDLNEREEILKKQQDDLNERERESEGLREELELKAQSLDDMGIHDFEWVAQCETQRETMLKKLEQVKEAVNNICYMDDLDDLENVLDEESDQEEVYEQHIYTPEECKDRFDELEETDRLSKIISAIGKRPRRVNTPIPGAYKKRKL